MSQITFPFYYLADLSAVSYLTPSAGPAAVFCPLGLLPLALGAPVAALALLPLWAALLPLFGVFLPALAPLLWGAPSSSMAEPAPLTFLSALHSALPPFGGGVGTPALWALAPLVGGFLGLSLVLPLQEEKGLWFHLMAQSEAAVAAIGRLVPDLGYLMPLSGAFPRDEETTALVVAPALPLEGHPRLLLVATRLATAFLDSFAASLALLVALLGTASQVASGGLLHYSFRPRHTLFALVLLRLFAAVGVELAYSVSPAGCIGFSISPEEMEPLQRHFSSAPLLGLGPSLYEVVQRLALLRISSPGATRFRGLRTRYFLRQFPGYPWS